MQVYEPMVSFNLYEITLRAIQLLHNALTGII